MGSERVHSTLEKPRIVISARKEAENSKSQTTWPSALRVFFFRTENQIMIKCTLPHRSALGFSSVCCARVSKGGRCKSLSQHLQVLLLSTETLPPSHQREVAGEGTWRKCAARNPPSGSGRRRSQKIEGNESTINRSFSPTPLNI